MSQSDIEKARNNLNISGYVHPDSTTFFTSSVKDKYYKVYDEENTDKKSYDKAGPSSSKKYSSFSEKISELYSCPECGEKAKYTCDCELEEKECKKGHIWYKNKEGKICMGDPHANDEE